MMKSAKTISKSKVLVASALALGLVVAASTFASGPQARMDDRHIAIGAETYASTGNFQVRKKIRTKVHYDCATTSPQIRQKGTFKTYGRGGKKVKVPANKRFYCSLKAEDTKKHVVEDNEKSSTIESGSAGGASFVYHQRK